MLYLLFVYPGGPPPQQTLYSAESPPPAYVSATQGEYQGQPPMGASGRNIILCEKETLLLYSLWKHEDNCNSNDITTCFPMLCNVHHNSICNVPL